MDEGVELVVVPACHVSKEGQVLTLEGEGQEEEPVQLHIPQGRQLQVVGVADAFEAVHVCMACTGLGKHDSLGTHTGRRWCPCARVHARPPISTV